MLSRQGGRFVRFERMKTLIRCAAWLLAVATLPLSAADPKPKAKAKEMAPAGVPAISRLEPRGIQRGVETRLKLVGSNLAGLTNVTFHSPKLTGALLPEAQAGEAWLTVTAAPDLARGSYELSVKSAAGESARVKVFVDDLRQVSLDAARQEQQ